MKDAFEESGASFFLVTYPPGQLTHLSPTATGRSNPTVSRMSHTESSSSHSLVFFCACD